MNDGFLSSNRWQVDLNFMEGSTRSTAEEVETMNRQRAALDKMRRIATGLLVGMLVLFVLSRSLEGEASGWAWVRAFAEAAMIGALADWFAVSALFRHPLGLPIPHTAIVRQEKDRIGVAVARFIRGSFLTPREVQRQWDHWRPLERLLSHFSHVEATRTVLRWVVSQGPRLLKGKGDRKLARLLTNSVTSGLQNLPLGKLANIALEAFLKSPTRRKMISPVLGRIARTVAENKDWVEQEAVKSATPYKSSLLDRFSKAATQMVSGKAVEKFSAQMEAASKDENHPLYDKIEDSLREAAQELGEMDPAHWSDLKDRILGNQETDRILTDALHKAAVTLSEGAEKMERDGTLDQWAELIAESVANLGKDFSDLDSRVKAMAGRLAENYGVGVERLISQTVAGWEAEELIERLETQVGADLQFIRINGTLIGGTIGVLLHGLALVIWH